MVKKVEKVERAENAEACSHGCCDCGKGCCGGKLLLVLLAAVGTVAAIFAWIYSCKALNVAQKSYELNVLSAGGQENLDKYNELYKSDAYVAYMTQSTDANIESFYASYGDETDNTVNDSSETSEPEFGSEGTLSASDIAALKENGVIYGPSDARITILEFADASCGYCKRQIGQDMTVDTVMAQYPNDVNLIFKNFPIFNETAAEAMACTEDYLSAEDYHAFVVSVFQADDPTSVDALANLAASYGADATTIANCVNNGDKANEVSATMAEGQSFGISGTPSSVIINNESGEFSLVPGAYPASTFVETIEALLS